MTGVRSTGNFSPQGVPVGKVVTALIEYNKKGNPSFHHPASQLAPNGLRWPSLASRHNLDNVLTCAKSGSIKRLDRPKGETRGRPY
jgi:hypothetical protein